VKVLIAGAGVGGLTLSLMLHRRGVQSVIFEQASEIREVGVGINILPHAIRELAALDLMPKLDAVGIRTKELHYVSRLGQKVWTELRGMDAGFEYPQFSIHRGRLQKVIHDEVITKLGPGAVRTGLRVQGFMQGEGGVVAHFTDAKFGVCSETARGDVLVGADGIHSVVRRHFYPKQGPQNGRGLCSGGVRRNGRSSLPAAQCTSLAA
jgi:2-polyprenyl-6-methoxyphenol hydroxylase-like FAD-dependent oxidoreductase